MNRRDVTISTSLIAFISHVHAFTSINDWYAVKMHSGIFSLSFFLLFRFMLIILILSKNSFDGDEDDDPWQWAIWLFWNEFLFFFFFEEVYLQESTCKRVLSSSSFREEKKLNGKYSFFFVFTIKETCVFSCNHDVDDDESLMTFYATFFCSFVSFLIINNVSSTHRQVFHATCIVIIERM